MPDIELSDLICAAAREYLAAVLHCDSGIFTVESVVRGGSLNLRRVIGAGKVRPYANDTSFGAGFAPYSYLENIVLMAGAALHSPQFRLAFPATGDDYKLMGSRIGDQLHLTIALAFVDSRVSGVGEYFAIKAAMVEHLGQALHFDGAIDINALDDPAAVDESGLYLTVTGLSAEHGDDGQVGRGNRVNGLITPGRTMSLEAAAGKNAMAHVGKIYNVLAHRMAHAIAAGRPALTEVSVQVLSTIGKVVEEPELVAIRTVQGNGGFISEEEVLGIARVQLGDIDVLLGDLVRGSVSVF